MTTPREPPPGLASADWADETSRRWSAHADQLEAMLAPVDGILLPAAHISTGEWVLDVGCGRGVTTRSAATLTGPAGALTGIDISATLVTEATTVAMPDGAAPITWITADAATHAFPPDGYDLVLSRFGIMFFDEPVAAFANLRRAVRPGGRLVAAVWQPQDASEFQWLSIEIALRVAAEHGYELRPDPPDAGPFAYGSAEHTTPILEAAGWRDVDVAAHEVLLYAGGPGTTPERAVEMGRQIGPFGWLLRDAPPEVIDAAADAVIEEFHTRWDGTGVPLRAGIAIVSAHRPSPRS